MGRCRDTDPQQYCASEAAWQRVCGQGSAWPRQRLWSLGLCSHGSRHVPARTGCPPSHCGSRQDLGAPLLAQRQGVASTRDVRERSQLSPRDQGAEGPRLWGTHPFRASLDKSKELRHRLSCPLEGRPPYLLPPLMVRPAFPSGHVCLHKVQGGQSPWPRPVCWAPCGPGPLGA